MGHCLFFSISKFIRVYSLFYLVGARDEDETKNERSRNVTSVYIGPITFKEVKMETVTDIL